MSQANPYTVLTEESSSSPAEEYDDDDDEYLDYTSESEYEYELSAQEHWEESVKQLTALFSIVVFPLIGNKIIWRRVANWWFV
ncbi:hypothetical protein Cantr_03598 [Candida viswanathii]|uniref:Uncharacterized protein n=1 Tax=Candida viswanathii TaxID=5486 RepID=A0A367YL83_9ASCO|nr:hypothetical protein Cantr_03574 [Candida viswanathii]RCK66588.1 hypothetical protein Cantr_03598 [Candida viswanathii]